MGMIILNMVTWKKNGSAGIASQGLYYWSPYPLLINFKTCIALVLANPATITLDMQTVANLERVEIGPEHVIQLLSAECKNL